MTLAHADAQPPYALEEQIGFLLRIAAQRNSAIFQQLAFDDLTTTQFSALIRLAQMGECSQNDLGRRTAMDGATIKGVIDRLQRKGYIEIRQDLKDRRRSVLSIAPGHRGLRAKLEALGHAVTEETFAPLSSEERAVFLPLLKRLTQPIG